MTQAPSQRPERSVPCIHCQEAHPVSYTHCPKTGKPFSSGRALVGRVIGERYRIVGLLGEGGMGAVYVAEHVLIGRKVAIKRLHPELATEEKAIKRFQREAQAAAATKHENIVEVLDLGFAEDGAPYIVMEYLKGKSLAATLRKEGRLAPTRACHIVGQILAALSVVHRSQIVHRDLKPDNVYLTRRSGHSDHVKVLDFGVSKIMSEDQMDLTRTGVLLGTPFYMSPEQARGMKDLDHRVDLYAAGVLLYECLTGRLPFEGGNYHALLQAILVKSAPPVRELVSDVPDGLARVVSRALARDRTARYQSAEELLEALLPWGASEAPEELPDSIPPPYQVYSREGGEPVLSRSSPTQLTPIALAATEGASTERELGQGPPSHHDDNPRSITGRLPRPRSLSGSPSKFEASSADWREQGQHRAVTGSARMSPVKPAYGASPFTPPPLSTPVGLTGPSTPSLGLGAPAAVVGTQIKGSLLSAAIEHVEQTHGRDALTAMLDQMAPTHRNSVSGMVMPVAWFPLDVYEQLLAAAERALGGGDGSTALEIGAATASRELPTTHRLLVQSATPAAAVARVPQLFRAYHSNGRALLEPVGDGSSRVELLDLSPNAELHAMAMCGFHRRLLELTGGRDVRVALLSSRARGDARTVLSLRWR